MSPTSDLINAPTKAVLKPSPHGRTDGNIPEHIYLAAPFPARHAENPSSGKSITNNIYASTANEALNAASITAGNRLLNVKISFDMKELIPGKKRFAAWKTVVGNGSPAPKLWQRINGYIRERNRLRVGEKVAREDSDRLRVCGIMCCVVTRRNGDMNVQKADAARSLRRARI